MAEPFDEEKTRDLDARNGITLLNRWIKQAAF